MMNQMESLPCKLRSALKQKTLKNVKLIKSYGTLKKFKTFSPVGKTFSPVGKTFSPVGKTFGPVGKTFGPVGKIFITVCANLFPGEKCAIRPCFTL